jgi:uncharacterized protein YidB (DUF937 family)
MTALLGLLAIAGYQNRDKLTELLKGVTGAPATPAGSGTAQQSQEGGSIPQMGGAAVPPGLGGLLSGMGGAGLGGLIGGGLSELVKQFDGSGQKEVADSWVGTGPNKDVTPGQLENAIGPDVLATLSQQLGLSKDELLARLSRTLPEAVDKFTPNGRLPTEDELRA